ncbi:MAG TPA: helix-turn-helix transcriptional regulator [Candidatus Hydrogenedentes bacterium]|nr:helix-turn-helix transcriptional regulator [Candidatus Hydrogenedentota bacterium]
MTSLEFVRDETVQAALERAAHAAGMPLSLHYVERNQEGPKIGGDGSCAACRYVADLHNGHRACRQSRLIAAAIAQRQERALPFICHMGFSCLTIQAIPGQNFMLTFGPYVPANEAQALEFDALQGLANLTGEKAEEFPVPLDDIHHAPASAVPALAQWTVDTLAMLWHQIAGVDETLPEEQPEPEPQKEAWSRKRIFTSSGQPANAITTALAAGDLTQVRNQLRTALEETRTHARVRIGVRRARVLSLTTAVLEAAERAGMTTAPAWEIFPVFLTQLQDARNDHDVLEAGMRLLEQLSTGKTAASASYEELNKILSKHLTEGITLKDAARQLGELPSAITHRLQRKFGMSYSEYVARLRIDKAKDLLRHTKFNATEIGSKVGIDDQSNFGKTFLRLEGMTPIEYREQFKRKK